MNIDLRVFNSYIQLLKGEYQVRKNQSLLLIVATVGQVIGIIFVFINLKIAIIFYVIYLLAVIALFSLLIRERLNEKKEEDENDFSDY